MNQSGQRASEFKIGSTNPNQREKRQAVPEREKMFQFSLFRLLFIFAAVTTNFTVASHNLHSFKKSSHFHKQCIEDYGGIWLGQELWLSEKQLPCLSSLGVNFVARSGMQEAVSTGILRGRPFGGVSIAWSPNLNHAIQPLANYKHDVVFARL